MMPGRRDIVIAGALIGAAGVAALGRPRLPAPSIDPGALAGAVPAAVGPYRHDPAGEVLLPPRDDLSLRTYDQYLARVYAAPDRAPVMLLIAYGQMQDYALQIHRPESCYPASGFRIDPPRVVPLRLGDRAIDAVALAARRPGRIEQILYWTRIGDRYPVSLWQEREAILSAALARRATDGVLVRLSTPSPDPADIGLLTGFAATLVAALAPAARRVVEGMAGRMAGRGPA